MKNIHLLGLLLLLPILAFPQKRCDELKIQGKTFFDSNTLDSALVYYLDAINCNPKLQEELGSSLLTIFKRIEAQRKREYTLRKKAERLLGYFFDEEVDKIPKDERAAWAQGKNGKYAVINWDGELLPAGVSDHYVWEEPVRFEDHRAIAKRGGLYYFINNLGEVTSEGFDLIHTTILSQSLGVQKTVGNPLEVPLNPKTGIKLNNIRILKTGTFTASNSVFPFETEGQWGLMKSDGEYLDTSRYDYVGNLYGGFARINIGGYVNDTTGAITGGKWGFMDKTGKVKIEPAYLDVGELIDNVAWVRDSMGYSLLYLDTDNSLKLYEDSLFTNLNTKMEFGIVKDKNLNKVYKSYFSDKINRTGELQETFYIEQDGFVASPQSKKSALKGLVQYKVQGNSQMIEKFRLNDQFGYKDMADSIVIAAKYDEIIPRGISSDKVILETRQRALHGLEVLIDHGGKRSQYIRQTSGNKSLVFDRFRSLPCDYEAIGHYRDKYSKTQSYVRVKQDGKWGYVFWDAGIVAEVKGAKVNGWRKRLIPCQYDVATDFYLKDKELVARVYMKEFNMYFYINTDGEMLGTIQRDSMYR